MAEIKIRNSKLEARPLKARSRRRRKKIRRRKKDKKESSNKFKFTEILLILSALGVVVFLVLLVINPNKEAAEARNLKRTADVSMILSYISSYANTVFSIPEEIPQSSECVQYGNEICKTGPFNCTDLVNMGFLSENNGDALVVMPNDPLYISVNGTGYFVSNNGNGSVTVCAPHAERNKEISFSKYIY